MKPDPPIDEKLLRAYVMLGARDADLSAIVGASISTLRRMFGPTLKKLRAERRAHIRQMVWEKARDGNAQLIIWLANAELDQDQATEPRGRGRQRVKFDFDRFAEEFRSINEIAPNANAPAADASEASGAAVNTSDANAPDANAPAARTSGAGGESAETDGAG